MGQRNSSLKFPNLCSENPWALLMFMKISEEITLVPLVFIERNKSQRNFTLEFLASHNGFILGGPFRLSDEIKKIIYSDAMMILRSGGQAMASAELSNAEGSILTNTVRHQNNCLFGTTIGTVFEVSLITGKGKDGLFTLFMKNVNHTKVLGGIYQFSMDECATVFGEPDHHQN